MSKSHKSRSGGRSTSQKSVTGVIANNCNNIVLVVLGAAFGGARQRCDLG